MTKPLDPGLCTNCINARQVTSGRGSIFWLCQKSETDPAFPKYPALPVLMCSGYQQTRGE